MGFFEDLFNLGDIDFELTDEQQIFVDAGIRALGRTESDTADLTEIVLNTMGLTNQLEGEFGTGGESGEIRRLTDDEYLSTLGEVEQQQFRNYQLQIERQKRALEGNLPVSEALQQRKSENFRIFKEQQARIGNTITGDDPDTAVANTTAGTQSLNSFRDEFNLLEDAERRGEIQTGQANINQTRGLVSGLEGADYSRAIGFPQRHSGAAGAGILNQAQGNQALFNAQRQAQTQSDLFGILTRLIP